MISRLSRGRGRASAQTESESETQTQSLSLKSQVVLLQTAHSWANAGVLLGARVHRERVAFETIKVSG